MFCNKIESTVKNIRRYYQDLQNAIENLDGLFLSKHYQIIVNLFYFGKYLFLNIYIIILLGNKYFWEIIL